MAGSTVKILDRPSRRMTGELFEPGHIQYVIKERLDDVINRFNLPIPNYLKIDVDGAEKDVVYGSEKTLKDKNVKSLLIELLDPDGKSFSLRL
jgi:FkbM family methyltransferase